MNFSISAVQYFSIKALKNFDMSSFQPFSISAFHDFSISVLQDFWTPPFLADIICEQRLIAVHHFNISAFLHFGISVFQHFSSSAFQRFSTSAHLIVFPSLEKYWITWKSLFAKRCNQTTKHATNQLQSLSIYLQSFAGLKEI